MTTEDAIKAIEEISKTSVVTQETAWALDYAMNAIDYQMQWISVKDRLPECEKPVLAAVKNCFGNIIITKGMYEDGKMIPQYSVWCWDEWDEWGVYDEEIDEYYIPEGWFEWNNFSENCGVIDQEVTHWMPLPSTEGLNDSKH